MVSPGPPGDGGPPKGRAAKKLKDEGKWVYSVVFERYHMAG